MQMLNLVGHSSDLSLVQDKVHLSKLDSFYPCFFEADSSPPLEPGGKAVRERGSL